jgi:ribosomal protein L37AE/L43A
MNCPKCGSENVSTERRIDGMKTCLDCDYKWRNVSQAGHVVTSCHEDRTYKRNYKDGGYKK